MNGIINKISKIRNIAVFDDFDWAKSVRDKGNNVAEFKALNIIYGRNYSGKTTLSRIIRSLETGNISENYSSPEFEVIFNKKEIASHINRNSHNLNIRVFNEDFVKENLKFISDDSKSISPFAVLGENNSQIEEKILALELELGSQNSGVLGSLEVANQKYLSTTTELKRKEDHLDSRLKDKANKPSTGIKHNKYFGDANYNINKLNSDIKTVSLESYIDIDLEVISAHHSLLKEELKPEIATPKRIETPLESLLDKAKLLVEKKIPLSDRLQELLNDTTLENWVRQGKLIHEDKKDHCGFCGNPISKSLWKKLDDHFNQESESLRIEIQQHISKINTEKTNIEKHTTIKPSELYSVFSKDLETIESIFHTAKLEQIDTLESVAAQLYNRSLNIFKPLTFMEVKKSKSSILEAQDDLEAIIKRSNEFSSILDAKQQESRQALRLHEVFIFLIDIDYNSALDEIQKLAKEQQADLTRKNLLLDQVNNLKNHISSLRAQLKDESKGAEKVNEYLDNFFEHQGLQLTSIEEPSTENYKSIRFEVSRKGAKAFHLSEGECSLIAFCYFMAKLNDHETKGKQPIIWIDDPICSLDSNHIFFVYSLIHAEIMSPETRIEDGEEKKIPKHSQLFISTHNLEFLKYLKRLPGAGSNKTSEYFTTNRVNSSSQIKIMPDYLKNYVTEFNYLFSEIYKCSQLEHIDDGNYTAFYNFGNNARKFFEIYLYYKYPDRGMTDETIEKFFGDDIPAILTNRINNEYSHLAGVFERGSTPVEIPEMQISAKLIIECIKKNDPHQYQSLLKSVGIHN